MTASDPIYPEAAGEKPNRPAFDLVERAVAFFIILGFSNVIAFLLLGSAASDPHAQLSDVSALARLSWYPIYLLILVFTVVKWRQMIAALPKVWPMIILFGLALASTNWSLDPSLTQRRCIALFFTMHAGFYLAARAPLLDTLRLMGWAWLLLGLLSLAFVFLIPSLGVDHEIHVGAWTGFLGTKNLLGGEFARANLIFGALLFFDKQNRAIWLAGFALSVVCVLGSTSMTALLAMAAPYSLYVGYLIARRSVVAGLFSIWAAATIAGAGYFILTNFSEELVALIGKDLTLTGRTDIWALCLSLISDSKWTGYGYAAFWKVEDGPVSFLNDYLQWDVPSAHNSWIETGLSLGYPGMALLGVAAVMALYKALGLSTGRHGPFPLMILVQILLFSLSESLLLQQNLNASMLFWFIISVCLISRPAPNTRRERDKSFSQDVFHRPKPV